MALASTHLIIMSNFERSRLRTGVIRWGDDISSFPVSEESIIDFVTVVTYFSVKGVPKKSNYRSSGRRNSSRIEMFLVSIDSVADGC